MKLLLSLFILLFTYANAANINIDSFEADFVQTITDENSKVLKYKGHIIAAKPKSAAWYYTEPLEKKIYLNKFEATIVEPEIEQVIIRKFHNELDFFQLIKKAKKISKNSFVTVNNNTKYTIEINNEMIRSVSYLDQFENKVKILFSNQKQNHKIDKDKFLPKYPMDYDIVNE
jgi:outer membrane lipoprotein carrier protein